MLYDWVGADIGHPTGLSRLHAGCLLVRLCVIKPCLPLKPVKTNLTQPGPAGEGCEPLWLNQKVA